MVVENKMPACGTIDQQLESWKKKIEEDGLMFVNQLFFQQTVEVLAAKYAYYQSGKKYMDDDEYDLAEFQWYVAGRALGYLKEDETSPCVGFDENHQLQREAIALAEKYMR